MRPAAGQAQFSRKELGLTLGAPIIRDRVALFVNADVNREVTPQTVPVPVPGDTTTGALRYESLVRFRDLLRSYGVEPGSFSTGSYSTPSRNLFFKITAQLGLNSSLAVSHNYGHGNDRREIGASEMSGLYGLSSSGSQNPETINATRLAWTTAFGARFTNQMTLARVDDRRTCVPSSDFPAVSLVDNDSRPVSPAPNWTPAQPGAALASRPDIRSGKSPTTSAWRRETTGSRLEPMPNGSTWWRTCWTSPRPVVLQ